MNKISFAEKLYRARVSFPDRHIVGQLVPVLERGRKQQRARRGPENRLLATARALDAAVDRQECRRAAEQTPLLPAAAADRPADETETALDEHVQKRARAEREVAKRAERAREAPREGQADGAAAAAHREPAEGEREARGGARFQDGAAAERGAEARGETPAGNDADEKMSISLPNRVHCSSACDENVEQQIVSQRIR